MYDDVQIEAAHPSKNAEAMPEVVDETIDLWTKMLEADQKHDDQIVDNVETMQTDADAAV